jgi:transcriptional regulator with XRE-family HTH domain
MSDVGERIRELRLARGLSQRAISEPGTSYAYISRIESGARQPSLKAIRTIASKLGVTPEYLETGEDPVHAVLDRHKLSDLDPADWEIINTKIATARAAAAEEAAKEIAHRRRSARRKQLEAELQELKKELEQT